MFCGNIYDISKVYGIECSGIVHKAREIIRENQLEEVITIVEGKVEEVELPLLSDGIVSGKVDVIISEWMGYFLLYESMLESVIFARDKWLKPKGIMLPDSARLRVCAIEDEEYMYEKIDFWKDVYGFKMNCIRKLALEEPLVDTVESKQVVTDDCIVHEIDISDIEGGNTSSFEGDFSLVANRSDYIHALVGYFDCTFSDRNSTHLPLTLRTGPLSEYTHWKQTVFYLDEAISISEGESITGTIICKPNHDNPRDLDIKIKYSFQGRNGHLQKTVQYKMR